jgi:hypothetical protein
MDVDIRPVSIDKLAGWEESAVDSRLSKITQLLEEHEKGLVALQEEVETRKRLVSFLRDEKRKAGLALELSRGLVVRVVCPECQGTGMRPSDVVGGRISKGSAFEAVGRPQSSTEPDARARCKECNGQRWIIMTRFRG